VLCREHTGGLRWVLTRWTADVCCAGSTQGGQTRELGGGQTLHSPNLSSVRHTGMRSSSKLCKKPHVSPFMHMFFNQNVHTVCSSRAGAVSRALGTNVPHSEIRAA
jgi:hypothetical protein